MIPQPTGMRLVSRAMMAAIAVDERASYECLRHQGYASASQKVSNPALSHACAICTVSATGSMLSCNTPIRKGTAIWFFAPSFRERVLRIRPGMFEAFDQGPHCFVQRCRDSHFLAGFHNRPIHEIDFGDASDKHILQHARIVFAGRIRTFLNESARIAMKRDAERFGDRFALGDEVVEELAGSGKARRRTVMQERERANRICRRIEDKFRPLRAA